MKDGVARDNTTFKVSSVKELVKSGMSRIDQQRWSNACKHVEEKIEETYWKNDGIYANSQCSRIIINIDSDSEGTEAGESSESDDDTEA